MAGKKKKIENFENGNGNGNGLEAAGDQEAAASLELAPPGPAETTVDKGPDDIFWRCPHCKAFYKKDADIARKNHMARNHGIRER